MLEDPELMMSVPDGGGLHQDIVKKGLTTPPSVADKRASGPGIKVNNRYITSFPVNRSVMPHRPPSMDLGRRAPGTSTVLRFPAAVAVEGLY